VIAAARCFFRLNNFDQLGQIFRRQCAAVMRQAMTDAIGRPPLGIDQALNAFV
jgi:hypothetical protein